MVIDFPRRTFNHVFLERSRKEAYEPLQNTDETKGDPELDGSPKTRPGWRTVDLLLPLAAITILSGMLGFLLGRRSWNPSKGRVDDFLTAPGRVKYPMIYNITYTKEPSPETDEAWEAMFPVGVGFVKHPSVSPELSGLAVFHELHCVVRVLELQYPSQTGDCITMLITYLGTMQNMLRAGYYAALNGHLADMQHIHDHNKRPDPHHLRHCFDYLRQSLICMADTNLEPVDRDLGGVTGWEFERTCRDFEKVKAWANRWHSWDFSMGGLESP